MKLLYYFIILSLLFMGCESKKRKNYSLKTAIPEPINEIKNDSIVPTKISYQNHAILEIKNTSPSLVFNNLNEIDTSFYEKFLAALISKTPLKKPEKLPSEYSETIAPIKIEFENEKLLIASYWSGYYMEPQAGQHFVIFSKENNKFLQVIEVGHAIPDQGIFSLLINEGKFLPKLTYVEIDSNTIQLTLTSYSFNCKWNDGVVIDSNNTGRSVLKAYEIIKVDSIKTDFTIEDFIELRMK